MSLIGAATKAVSDDNFPSLPVSDGGSQLATIVAGTTTNTTITPSRSRLCRILVTAAGTAALTLTNGVGGAVIGIVPANAAVGSVYAPQMPADSGIVAVGGANTPGVTVSYL